MNIKQQIELAIARLERENTQLLKLLQNFGEDLQEEKTDEVLDQILKNKELIEKLKRGLQ